MSALGHKRTYAPQKAMSALPLIADICVAQAHVRFGPKADLRRGSIFLRLLPPNLSNGVRREHCVGLSQMIATLGQQNR